MTLTKQALTDIDRIKKNVSDAPLRYERKGFKQKMRSFPVDVYETRDAFVIDGVLTVKLPKPDRMKPMHIPVATDLNFTI